MERGTGPLVGGARGVTADHLSRTPAGEPHEVLLLSAAGQPGVGVGVPEAVRVHVRVVSEPSGAEVSVARGAERRDLGRSPVDVTLDNDGAPWTVEVNKSGFDLFRMTFQRTQKSLH